VFFECSIDIGTLMRTVLNLFPIRNLSIVILLTALSACGSSGSDSLESNTTTSDTSIVVGPDNSNTEGTNTGNTSTEGDSTSGDAPMQGTTGDGTAGTTSGDTTNSDNTTGDTTTVGSIPQEPEGETTSGASIDADPPSLVASASLPTLSADGNVSWAFDATPSGLEVHVQPFVEMPLATNGEPARWNDIASFGDRIFAVDEQDGRVYEITNRQVSLWFDISSAIQSQTGRSLDIQNVFHGGVRGIAFHPEFANNGKFYATLMEQRPSNPALHTYLSDSSNVPADSVLVEWTANTSNFEIDTSSYRELFRVGIPEYDHPIKQIAFNPNLSSGDSDFGNLYISHGDGSVESTLTGSGQNNDALGKILRINPLQNGEQNYTVPADNPFINDASMLDEVFSYGHRNPHHLAFSRNGQLLTTEAGRDNIDEINLVENGQDYGWSEREGSYVHLDAGGLSNGVAALPENDAVNGFIYPVAQFGHTGAPGAGFTGEALGGGHIVENGSPIDGQFFYIDFVKSGILFHSALSDILQANTTGAPATLTNAQSYIATVRFDHDSNPDTEALNNDLREIVQSAPGYVNTFDRVDVRIEQGPNGVMYMMSKRNNMIYLVTSSLPGGPGASEARP